MLALFAQSGSLTPAQLQANYMSMLIPVVGIVAGCTVAIVAIVMVSWRKRKEHEDLAVLKQQMLDRGMSADEIAKVIEATPW